MTAPSAEVTYLWDGTKVKTSSALGHGRLYKGSFVYSVSPTSTQLERISHDEGRILAAAGASGTEFIDTWHVRDYLGSVRAVYDISTPANEVADASEHVLEQSDYYAFGGRIDDGNQAFDQTNRYRYNGKEQLRFESLNLDPGLTDYGARYYAPTFGRWTTPDPLADKYYSVSPYAFCNNNPVNFVDPDGKSYGDYYSYTGEYIASDGIEDNKVYLVRDKYIDTYRNSVERTENSYSAVHELKKGAKEVGGLIIQSRFEETDTYTISEFHTVGGDESINGYILEPAGPSTTVSNQNKRVPEGLYNIDNYSSKRYPSNFVLYNDLVPKDRAVLYHIGNSSEDTRGCMLPGTTYNGNDFIGDSTTKFKELKRYINSIGANNVKVIVKNSIR